MTGFLEEVAIYLNRVHGEELHRFCIVFPNIRAGLFFKKYLAQLLDKPVWAPAFRSLNSMMEDISGLTQADRLSLIFHLFQAFRHHRSTNESFDDFYFWGEMLLDDFDDIDKHLVDARDLFRNVSDLKEIDLLFDYLSEEQKNAIRIFWQNFNSNVKQQHAASLQTDFANIWSILYPIYETFKQMLLSKSLGYEGMIQREAVRLLREGAATHAPYDKYVFVGFNALTPCESFFFKSLQKQNKALFFWDYDDYYLSNTWHEAGMFMRENLRQFPEVSGFSNLKPQTSNFKLQTSNLKPQTSNLKLEIISVPSDTGQAKLAGQLLEEFYAGKSDENWDWSRAAVVLPDEYMLLPMLSSLPESAGDVNITMGYPFTCTPANSLFERLVSLQQRVRQYSDGARFYHNDVCTILNHPYIQRVIPDEAASVVKNIIERNRIYVPQKELSGNELMRLIFKHYTQAREFSEYLLAIVSCIAQHETRTAQPETKLNPTLETEYLYCLYNALTRIHEVVNMNEIDMDARVFCRLLRKVFASLKIPFKGEPLKGLQLMGMLETRTLDFDHVIILSMNEGIFPKANPKQSFVPYHLRKGFGLTTSERHDAVSAYLFYRLIQRATNVRLIYNSAATDNNTGEMSRFLSQLIYEPVFNVRQRNFTFRVNIDRNISIVKERTEKARHILNMYTAETGEKRKLSPSALNSYLDCRLKFYFRYVDGLKERDELIDEIEYSVFGKLLHKTMELMYRPYLNTEITAEIFTHIQKDRNRIQKNLYRAFAEDYFFTEQVTESDITGRNIIIREVLLKYIMRILEIDRQYAPFTILSLEEPLDVDIPIRNPEGVVATRLHMHGFIDRLDLSGNSLRIIDYKTGNAQRNFTGVADLFDRTKSGNHAVLQTLVYACMTRIARKEYSRFSSCLYIVKELFKENYDPHIHISRKPPINDYNEVAAEFETELNQLLYEMFLSDTPFTQTDNIKNCQICPYADICHRN